ncbi:MAG: hypothetical protein KJP15_01050 [Gammaproteobacteria bacterium]|nr:hypothetical protein [Gammaproteobacteria bacterium]
MMKKEIIVLALLLTGFAGFLYAVNSQIKLKRLRNENENAEGPLDNINAEQLARRRRVLAGYGIFIVSGIILGFVQ